MEENKFERQVQQKMDELKIHPSDSVWEKIEALIEKKKRPNRGLIFFILLFCLLLTGGYFLLNINHHPGKEDHSKEANSSAINNHKDTDTSEKTTHEISSGENKTEKPQANFVAPSINQTVNEVGNTIEKKNVRGNSLRHNKSSTSGSSNTTMNSGEESTITSSPQKEIANNVSGDIKSTQGTEEPGKISSPVEKNNEASENSTHKKDSMDLPSIPLAKEQVAEGKDTSEQKQKTIAVLHSKKNKWKFGILFSAGISSIGNTFPGLDNSSAYLNDPATGGMSGGLPAPFTPSRIKPGFGFTAGVVAEKNISEKVKLVTGLNYGSFNTSNIVGERNDTTGYYNYNSVYAVNAGSKYKNHYNFIELPVAIKVQLGRGKNIPLFWQGGFVVSSLVNTNGLQFNQGSGYYYADNSIFNKTQIGVSTSLSVALFSKQKNSILIGPYFYYGASRLANEGLYNKKHFIFPGLRTEIIFGK